MWSLISLLLSFDNVGFRLNQVLFPKVQMISEDLSKYDTIVAVLCVDMPFHPPMYPWEWQIFLPLELFDYKPAGYWVMVNNSQTHKVSFYPIFTFESEGPMSQPTVSLKGFE
jgi:hypothetical protein